MIYPNEVDIKNVIIGMKENETHFVREKYATVPKMTTSDLYVKKMKELVHRVEANIKRSQIRRVIASIAVASMVLIAFIQPQFYVSAANQIVEFFRDHVQFTFSNDNESCKVPAYELGYLPEGYSVTEDVYEENGISYVICTNQDGELISFIYAASDGTIEVNFDGVTYERYIDKKGNTIYYFQSSSDDDSSNQMLWDSDGVAFQIIGEISKTEMEKIKDNIVRR